MKTPALLITLLILATLSLDAVVLATIGGERKGLTGDLLLSGLVFSQVGLLSMWFGLGRTWVMFRFLSAGAGVALASGLLVKHVSNDPWLVPVLASSVLIVVAMLVLRLARFQVTPFDSQGDATTLPPEERRLQFSIAQMLLWTTMIALLAGGFRAAGIASLPVGMLGMGAAIGVAFGVVSVAACWAALGRMFFLVRVIGLLAGWFVVVASISWLLGGRIDFDDEFSIVLGLTALLTFASLLVLRVGGVRLQRSQRPDGAP